MPFSRDQLARVEPIWKRILEHRFLSETRDGTIAQETFANWMRQDYLFVEAAIPFIATLIPKAPKDQRPALGPVIPTLEKELELFRERAAAAGVSLERIEPAFVNHAYIQFLLATGYGQPYAVGLTVLYVAEKAYYDSWLLVKAGLQKDSIWYPFVENWTSAAFASWVDWLEAQLDETAQQVGPATRLAMEEAFELTAKYELAFWEMAVSGATWPCLQESS